MRSRRIEIDDEDAGRCSEALEMIQWLAGELRRSGIPETAQIVHSPENLYDNDGLTVGHILDLAEGADALKQVLKPE